MNEFGNELLTKFQKNAPGIRLVKWFEFEDGWIMNCRNDDQHYVFEVRMIKKNKMYVTRMIDLTSYKEESSRWEALSNKNLELQKVLAETLEEKEQNATIASNENENLGPKDFVAIGSQAENVLRLIHGLDRHFKISINNHRIKLTGHYRWYILRLQMEEGSVVINNGESNIAIIKSETDIQNFVNLQTKISQQLQEAEDRIVTFAQTIEPTTYYRRKSKSGSYLMMLGDEILFSIIECGNPLRPKYKTNFNRKTMQSTSLDALENKIKEAIKIYYKKNRLHSITSKDITMAARHFYTMFGKDIAKGELPKKIISSLEYEQIMNVVKTASQQDISPIEEDEFQWAETYVQSQKMKVKIKKGYIIKNLYFLITASKAIVFEKEKVRKEA